MRILNLQKVTLFFFCLLIHSLSYACFFLFQCANFCFVFYIILCHVLLFCHESLFLNESQREADLDVSGGGKKLGEVEDEETVFRIYYVK